MDEQKIKLTRPQRNFLEGYFEDILAGDFEFDGMEKQDFIERVSRMDFDDGMALGKAHVRVGRNLNRLGLFDDFDVHGIFQDESQEHIYLSFNAKGAGIMWDLMVAAAGAERLALSGKADATN